MRALSGTLEAAQRRLEGQRPVVKLDVSDRPVEIPRWDWAVQSSEAVASCHGAAALVADGSLVRVRVKTDGTLQVSRITDLVSGSWTAWTTLSGGPYSTSAQVGVAGYTDGPTVVISYVGSDNRTVYYRVSGDYGASWGAEGVVSTETVGTAVKGLALCGGPGYVYHARTVDTGGAEPNDAIRVWRYNGSWWYGSVDSGHDSLTCCGTLLEGTTQVIVVGGASGLKLRDYDWALGAWGGSVLVAPAGSGAGYSFEWPRIVKSPDGSGRYYYTWLERWTGGVAGSRMWFACTKERGVLGEGFLFETNIGKGWDLIAAGDYWYAVCPVSHYRCARYTGSASQRKELGGDVVALELVEGGPNEATRGRVWLRNDDGRYANPGTGSYAMVREGSRVALGLGYRTSAGEEYVWLPPLWIERWRHVSHEGEAYLVLELGDAWSYLDRCRARYQVVWSGLTYGQIAQLLCYRVSGGVVGTVGALNVGAGVFTLRPGESVGRALRRLLEGAGARIRFGTVAVGGDPGAWDACVPTSYAIGSGSSGYSFGPGGHAVLEAEYESRGQPYNVVEVYGLGYWDYRRDAAHVKAAGHAWVEKETDWQLDSGGDVGARAVRLLYQSQRQLVGGWIEVMPHLGAELGDVVDVTDARAGLAGVLRRVESIRWLYDGRRRGRWVQRLGLEAV